MNTPSKLPPKSISSCKQSQSKQDNNVKVYCRVRPLNKKEIELSDQYSTIINNKTLSLNAQSTQQNFEFDKIYDQTSLQENIYEDCGQNTLESLFNGFNGTIFAYGQTSSGKTFTIRGTDAEPGLVPKICQQIFEHQKKDNKTLYKITVSIVEIYMEKIRDLIDTKKTNLQIRESETRGIYIQDVTEKIVLNQEMVQELLEISDENRAQSSTFMNEESSRSHCVFTLQLYQQDLESMQVRTSKLNIVDLAGSEKINKSCTQGLQVEEAKKINQSLLCLGNVINALTDHTIKYIPYRDSKLTRILQESLGGNSKTSVIITISPSENNKQESIQTLRFGTRAKNIWNTAKVNRQYSVQELEKILSDKNKTIEIKQIRINQLENFLKEKNIQLPEEKNYQQSLEENDTNTQFFTLLENKDAIIQQLQKQIANSIQNEQKENVNIFQQNITYNQEGSHNEYKNNTQDNIIKEKEQEFLLTPNYKEQIIQHSIQKEYEPLPLTSIQSISKHCNKGLKKSTQFFNLIQNIYNIKDKENNQEEEFYKQQLKMQQQVKQISDIFYQIQLSVQEDGKIIEKEDKKLQSLGEEIYSQVFDPLFQGLSVIYYKRFQMININQTQAKRLFQKQIENEKSHNMKNRIAQRSKYNFDNFQKFKIQNIQQ